MAELSDGQVKSVQKLASLIQRGTLKLYCLGKEEVWNEGDPWKIIQGDKAHSHIPENSCSGINNKKDSTMNRQLKLHSEPLSKQREKSDSPDSPRVAIRAIRIEGRRFSASLMALHSEAPDLVTWSGKGGGPAPLPTFGGFGSEATHGSSFFQLRLPHQCGVVKRETDSFVKG